ncbi:LOB domain-containing protein 36-like [Carica papaya]|uniref:LOB domain-containing protein 36-like n=1 Tax=Carica papaya TaxID=3649 RepID=UPI000B8D18EF|nr:LOB domain-containing protein 36-like [Carica papaya]
MSSSSSNSPCAACKFLRRKCTQECVFAPYFPPDQPQKFAYVHKVFGASNVAKILNELNTAHREDAVNSLFYEAEARLRDPVYGCVGLISILQHRLKQIQNNLLIAKKDLSNYIGLPAMLPTIQAPPGAAFRPQSHLGVGSSPLMNHNMMMPMMDQTSHGGGQTQQQIFELQGVNDQHHHQHQEMFRSYDQQAELVSFSNSGFETSTGSVATTGFGQKNNSSINNNSNINPLLGSLALGTSGFETSYRIQTHRAD